MHDFDKAYWEDHWQQSDPQTMIGGGPNPYLMQVATALEPGAALDAGCGTGAAAIWLAAQGWQVSGVDISASALRLAAHRAEHTSVSDRIDWIEADITRWAPDSAEGFDLVTTSYAHPDIAQLEFFDLLSAWVAPGGTLLIVGHLHVPGDGAHAHGPAAEATFTVADMVPRVDLAKWDIAIAAEYTRTVNSARCDAVLHDVVIQMRRRTA